LALILAWKVGAAEPRQDAADSPRQPQAGTITFNKDIAPIIWKQCAPCHRAGQAAPFNLLSYMDVRKRGQQIVEVITRRYMPPWLPEPGYGEFLDARVLGAGQIDLIRQWVAEGAPEGAPGDLPPMPQWTEGWQLGAPDLIIRMPQPYTLAAEGRDVYRNFVIPIPLTGPRYVKAVELQPDNPRIVHHAFMLLDRTGQARRLDLRDDEPGIGGLHAPSGAQSPPGQFLSWQPGKVHTPGIESLAWPLERGTDLILQTHLQPSGKPETLQASVGFYFTDAPPTNTPFKIGLRSYDIDIPAGMTNYVLTDSYMLPVEVEVLAVLPHAHYLARELQAFAALPDGATNWLLRIRNWDFNWQGEYRYAKPFALPKGTTIWMRYSYDNSTNNLRNPNHPPQRVRYGLQSADEMGELWLQVLARNSNDLAALSRDYGARVFRDAIAYNQFLLGRNPDDARAHLELGKVHTAQGRLTEALKYLRAAARLEPDSDDTHFYLGLCYQQQSRPSYARTEYERAVRLNPENVKARNNLGLLFLGQGQLDQAEEHFKAILRLWPDDDVAQSNLALVEKAKAERPLK
jgi:tetratricopeptide (TPR) repeat protein